MGIFRVESSEEKHTKPTLGRLCAVKFQLLDDTLLGIFGKVSDRGSTVDTDGDCRGRALGGQRKGVDAKGDLRPCIIAFDRPRR